MVCESLIYYIVCRLVDIVGGLNKDYIVWQDVVDNPVKVRPNTIIDVWRPGNDHGWQPEMARVTGQLGMKAVLSSCWYLDIISYGQDWPKVTFSSHFVFKFMCKHPYSFFLVLSLLVYSI